MAELTEARRKTLMAYCRIDEAEDGESELIETLYGAAVSYMTQAGISEPPEGTGRRSQYDLCVNYLALDKYQRRDMTITGTIVAENPAFRQMLNQLKWTEPVPDSGTGGE